METKTPHLTAALMAVGALVGFMILTLGCDSWLGYYLDVCEALQVTPTSPLFFLGGLVKRRALRV